ncbi:cystatin-like fold lipoprotein [Bacillus sp. ISL-51]|uniref:cystatin-like fold lipoprotein n=1 Tax=Bacteria TaxID=2 RepID=UPI001BE8282F|nr:MULTISPECIES: cystatin-like fold lipoprotein [Bacteria]MBT2572832.1 cystatin-like fold lipoprotein [Bacillus sp. ISL-51]MBT2635443.1 cystatin-like fold lipoprotein [Bacillus sp. ISL-26]MBT2713305.1 cystatin-like fold lipoprotein [Pseudomonas sp. ISL-88]
MKNLFIFLSISATLLLPACGGNKYDDAIDNVIKKYKDSLIEDGYDTDDVKRDSAVIRVYDGGKYIQLAFHNDGLLNYSTYDYYEKMGNDYEEMEHMPSTGEYDRLGLYKKTPDYEEVKGKETKTKE